MSLQSCDERDTGPFNSEQHIPRMSVNPQSMFTSVTVSSSVHGEVYYSYMLAGWYTSEGNRIIQAFTWEFRTTTQ